MVWPRLPVTGSTEAARNDLRTRVRVPGVATATSLPYWSKRFECYRVGWSGRPGVVLMDRTTLAAGLFRQCQGCKGLPSASQKAIGGRFQRR